MVASVMLLLLVICLHSRIQQGCKAVELAALFLFENCYLIVLPITQAILVAGGVAAIIMGSLALYSLGEFSFPNNSGFAHITLDTGHQVMVGLLIGGGLWVVFFFHGCNHFMLCSSAAVWYFNYESKFDLGRPFRDSAWRLIRYHSGSIAATSLANGFFFLFKLLAHIFSFSAKDEDNKCTAYCLKCLNCLFCIFRMYPPLYPASCACSAMEPTCRSQCSARGTSAPASAPSVCWPTTQCVSPSPKASVYSSRCWEC